jgi:hypothetical protein
VFKNQEEILDEIHNLRMRAFEQQESSKNKRTIKLTATKKEKDDILN